ncbi:FAD-binding oxidoreductase [Cognatishimia sp. F0-27]|uniref:FAD-binding oxidoreductase n=1 Tax=Cognatishimia sp. F0-27 TaxID=2816855 RepID=UPI001D0C7DD8|nr:FAD-binding oxidoreductase [Cognatishimia sp. F0-27]MCC1492224.1 FAD-binding oxidoreductase [Cognatishimia sp. F0-27]
MSDALISRFRDCLGAHHVLTGSDCAPWSRDWTGAYRWTPLCVVRPGSTAEVSAVMALCHDASQPVVPISGNTGLAGGTSGQGAVMLSMERLNAAPKIRPRARVAEVEAGVILSDLHDACAEHKLAFPMTFGARGSARIGGLLSTNAGGSNVLRYGNTRDLVLGLEAVMADGRVMDLTSALHKNNSGYDLRHLLIGAEGTLGIITRAMLKLVQKPVARATGFVGLRTLGEALELLNLLQDVSGGAVEAFEYMSPRFLEAHGQLHPEIRPVLSKPQPVTVLVELAGTAERDMAEDFDGRPVLAGYMEAVLTKMMEDGAILDAVVAQSEAQRAQFWAIRESAAEVSLSQPGAIVCDLAVALDDVEPALAALDARLDAVDPQAASVVVAHLGDGNIHYSVWPGETADAHKDMLVEAVEDVLMSFGGSFSAEHGIGRTKLSSMQRRKDAVALDSMRAIKSALDPRGILNPGAVIPI